MPLKCHWLYAQSGERPSIGWWQIFIWNDGLYNLIEFWTDQ